MTQHTPISTEREVDAGRPTTPDTTTPWAPPPAPTSTATAEPTGPTLAGPHASASRSWYRRRSVWAAVVALLVVGLGAAVLLTRGDSAPADPIAGRYVGQGDDGFRISFTVDERAEGITEASVQVGCGPIDRSETVTFTPALPIEGGRFDLAAPPSGGFGFDGHFVDDGAGATGDWSTGSCAGEWKAARVESAPAAPSEADDAFTEPEDTPAPTNGEQPAAALPEEPTTVGQEAVETITFDTSDPLWSSPEPGTYRATGSRDTFAWSEEIVEGDFVLRLDVTSDSWERYGEGMLIVYGDGASFSEGSLIFNITGYWQAIRAHSLYEEGNAEWLVENDTRLDFEQLDTFTMEVKVEGGIARLLVDDHEVAATPVTGDINPRGQIALVKYADSGDVTYSNIHLEPGIDDTSATETTATETTATETAADFDPAILIRLGESGDPQRPISLEVVTGDLRLVSGATLRAGSSISVVEEWMELEPGVGIEVGPGGVVLRGADYAEGTLLSVGPSGELSVEGEPTGGTPSPDPGLPSYSAAVAEHWAGEPLCETRAGISGGPEMFSLGDFGDEPAQISIREGYSMGFCPGSKYVVTGPMVIADGTEYPIGTLLTLDAEFGFVALSSWD